MAKKAHLYEAKFFRVFPIYLTIHPDSGVSWGVKSVGIPAAPIFFYFNPLGHGVRCNGGEKMGEDKKTLAEFLFDRE